MKNVVDLATAIVPIVLVLTKQSFVQRVLYQPTSHERCRCSRMNKSSNQNNLVQFLCCGC